MIDFSLVIFGYQSSVFHLIRHLTVVPLHYHTLAFYLEDQLTLNKEQPLHFKALEHTLIRIQYTIPKTQEVTNTMYFKGLSIKLYLLFN